KWSDGSQFDSSWERGAPFGFVLGQGQVITGWDESLVDAAVGSQLMLVIPPSEAYGDQGELAGETLIFVVDVLDAARPADEHPSHDQPRITSLSISLTARAEKKFSTDGRGYVVNLPD